MGTKLADVLKQTTVTIKAGDILASFNRSEGYVPTIKGTKGLHQGKHLYKVVGVGTAETDGSFKKLNIVPMKVATDGKSFIDDVKNPVVIQEPLKVTYMAGRNDPKFKDVYHGNCYKVNDKVVAGKEHREALLAFLEFTKSEFSLGVNDFIVAGAELN